ncbi:MAG: ImmA/IrrE family metallo-endopeptidase [Rhodobacterales bacterium]|nr:ImmA/IrrE family metallo-endopeptidase [Rhodobacterales bacterium]
MRSGIPGFRAERLVEARDSRGLTQVALAELINRTSSSISRWEGGGQLPEPEAMEALARALNVPIAFFLRPLPDHGPAPMFFRSMASTTQSVRKRTQARMRWAQDIALSLQELVDLPEVNVPRLDVTDHREIRDEDVERMANECRAAWELGAGPIADVLLVLENAGIVVVKEEVGTVTMDGLSNWSAADNRPYVLIARDKDTCVRSRMDAAHELGHLVLHHSLKPKTLNNSADFKEIERQAFDFAGAFLMPAESFSAEIWSPSLNAFVALKERWRASVGAMIMRCAKLYMLSEEHQRRLWKYYSSRGWRKSEPLDDEFVPEHPRLLSRSVRLLIEEKVRIREELLSDFRLHGPDVEALCGLPRGYMTTEAAEVVELPKLKRTVNPAEGGGLVVPFNRDQSSE